MVLVAQGTSIRIVLGSVTRDSANPCGMAAQWLEAARNLSDEAPNGTRVMGHLPSAFDDLASRRAFLIARVRFHGTSTLRVSVVARDIAWAWRPASVERCDASDDSFQLRAAGGG